VGTAAFGRPPGTARQDVERSQAQFLVRIVRVIRFCSTMLDLLQIPPAEIFSLLAAIGFAAGLNLYATVAVLGLLARFGHLPLPPGLQVLAGWPIIVASIALFVIEFFADKVPAFDLIWNALHTFIRVPVAGLLAYRATSQLSPEHQLLATLLGTVVALIAHSGKTAARAAVTPSPEPFSNIGLSLGEDALAIALTWLATRHPYIAGAVATLFVAIIVFLAHWVIRAMRSLFRGAEHELAG
jgi:Domain of unknown function (DUF4126)